MGGGEMGRASSTHGREAEYVQFLWENQKEKR
jgi:hypothetical protein